MEGRSRNVSQTLVDAEEERESRCTVALHRVHVAFLPARPRPRGKASEKLARLLVGEVPTVEEVHHGPGGGARLVVREVGNGGVSRGRL